MNGMTVLAAGTGETEVAGLSLEEAGGETGESSVSDELKGDTDDGEKDSEDKKQEGSEEKSEDGTEEKTEEGSEEGSETDGETGDGSLEDDNTEEVDSDDEELPTEEILPTEEKEKVAETEEETVRMETFTDASGMTITFNATAASAYTANVVDGTLVGLTNNGASLTAEDTIIDLRDNNEITEIGSSMFRGNANITYVMLPATVTKISDSAFEGCTSLKGVSIPSRLTSIGDSAFAGCKSLMQLAIPNSVTSIGANAFKGDEKLYMIHMVSAGYSKLTSIGDGAFSGCSALELFCSDEKFNLPKSITTIGESAFKGCKKIDKVSMSDTLTSIGESVFSGCTSLKEVQLSSGLSKIPSNAFEGCNRLVLVVFGDAGTSTEIEGYAFNGCSSLGSVELAEQITKIYADAFINCRNLKTISFGSTKTVLEDNAFPNGNTGICLVAKTNTSTAANYARNAEIRFVPTDEVERVEYYTYKAELSGAGTNTNPCITVKVTESNNSNAEDINAKVNESGSNNGVKAGTKLYLFIEYHGLQGIQPVQGSIKCNGKVIEYKDRCYSFTMPIGGATITAEFEYAASDVMIDGYDENVEGRLSSEANYDAKKKMGQLKVGQSTKFYLTNDYDGSESRIPTSKVTYSLTPSSPKNVVSVDKYGTIKALAEGTAVVRAEVKNKYGDVIIKTITIQVTNVDVDHISLLVKSSDKDITTEYDDKGDVCGVSIPSTKTTKNYSFDLKATAFSTEEDADEMDVAFKWTTSDAKIAKLAKTSTTAASSMNTVTIPMNTNGEATISVTATNPDKSTVTRTFIVSVQDYTPRLATSTITINPNKTVGAELVLISAYAKAIDTNSVEIVDAKTGVNDGDFPLTPVSGPGSEGSCVFRVSARSGLPDKTYSMKVLVNAGAGNSKKYQIPLKIIVKTTAPNPKVTLTAADKTQPKLNLFYANDGAAFKATVSNLGTEKVSKYSLEPLTAPGSKTYDDDKIFIDNFKIDSNTGVITRNTAKSESIINNSKGKPVVSGYLVLKFDGYKDSVVKKYKITIPTQTVAPSYVLNRTTDTFNVGYQDEQEVILELRDKKTQKAIDLTDDGKDTYTLTKLNSSTTSTGACEITDDGKIKLTLGQQPEAGKFNMKLTNSTWAEGKSFTYTYTIKTVSADPKISLKTATVTLNQSYPEQVVEFGFISNQYDTQVAEEQVFEPQYNTKTKVQYDKLEVKYENGKGTVSIKDGEADSLANGIYSFRCDVKREGQRWGTNAVVLKVKVAKSIPSVSAKGSVSFNLAAANIQDSKKVYVEEGMLTLTKKNISPDYQFDKIATMDSVVCTTKGYTDLEDCFKWSIEEETPTNAILKIKLLDEVPQKTFSFSITPVFSNKGNSVKAAPMKFNVKVYNAALSVSLSGKGKLNLLNRVESVGDCTASNSIIYTPVFKNLKDTVKEARIFDAEDGSTWISYDGTQSQYFNVLVGTDGKLYVIPKEDAPLQNNKTYQVKIWMKMDGYTFNSNGGGIWAPTILKIKTSEVLPKVATDKTEVNLYLSNKNYKTSFVISKKDAAALGSIESVEFGEKDTKAKESFEIIPEKQPDGSLKVYLKLKNTVSYSCNTTNKVTVYATFKDQGTTTAGTAITMNVKINK